jgi:CspA family cold shock protein
VKRWVEIRGGQLGGYTQRTFYSEATMATMNGTIKRLTDKGFGFIAANDGSEYFFHQSACSGMRFDELREGQSVTFERGQGPKGPRAENVRLGE